MRTEVGAKPSLHAERVARIPEHSVRQRIFGLIEKRDLNIALNISLLVLLMVSFISGWIASLMGMTEFGLHKYSSILVFAAAAGHLGLHWRSLASQLRRLRGTSPRPLHGMQVESKARATEDRQLRAA